jgi:phospholipid-translocating ATPase
MRRILETHSKSIIIFAGFAVSVAGWFLWNIILSRMYAHEFAIYFVRDNFLHNFGGVLSWWVTIALALFSLIVMELCVQAIRRVYWPTDQDLMQRIEKDAVANKIVRDRAAAAERGEAEELELQDVTAATSNGGQAHGHERKARVSEATYDGASDAWAASEHPRHERQQHYQNGAGVAPPQQAYQQDSWHQTRHDQRNPFNDY